MLENYRDLLLAKNDAGQPVDSTGPIVLGTRLESSIEPRAWRAITYGKGSWIIAKGVVSRCVVTGLLLCIALSRVVR